MRNKRSVTGSTISLRDSWKSATSTKPKGAREARNRRWRLFSRAASRLGAVSAALQIHSRDFDPDLFKLPALVQARIESCIDRLEKSLDTHPHHSMKGVDAYRARAGDYRIIYDFDSGKGVLYRLAVGHRREVYRR
jgi:mRNA interferase RelE/StbE